MQLIKRILLLFAIVLVPFFLVTRAQPVTADDDEETAPSYKHPYDPAGKEYIDRGDYVMGLGYFEEVMEDEKEARKPRIVLTLCRLYWVTGKYEEIIREVDAAAGRGVKSARLDLAKAEAQYRTGKIKEAGESFKKIAARNPALHKAQLDLGKFYYESGKLDDAYKIFRELSGLKDESYRGVPETLYCIGEAARMMNRYDVADKVLMLAYDKDAGGDKYYEEAYVARSQLYVDLFDIGFAYLGVLDQGLFKNNRRSPMGHVMKGWCLFYDYSTRRHFELAMDEAKYALRYNPNLIEALDLVAYIHTFGERFDNAQKYIDRALKINPNSLSTLAQQGFLYYFSGRMDKYREIEKRVLEINPKCAEFYYLIGSTMAKKYGFKYAVEFCEKAIALNPNFEVAYPVLARNLLFIGKEERGLKMLDRAWQTAGGYDPRVKNLKLVMDHVMNVDKEAMVTRRSEHFIMRLPKDEAAILGPYLENLLEDAWIHLSKKYDYVPEEKPILIEMFKDGAYFSARTTGLPGLGFAGGACFATFITARSPRGFFIQGEYRASWAQVAYHEFTHVITLQRAKSRVSRWLTEACSEMEQQTRIPSWGREEHMDPRFVMSLRADGVIPVTELDQAYVDQRMHIAYYQGFLTGCYLREKYGYKKIQEMLDEYAKRRSTAQVIEICLGMKPREFDKEFKEWCEERFKNFGMGAKYDKYDLKDLLRQLDKRRNWRNAALHAEVARAYLQNRNKEKFQEYAEKALKLDPNNGDIYALKGYLLLQGKNPKIDEAMPLLLKAEELKAKDIYLVCYSLARCYETRKDPANAEKYYLLARNAFPTIVGKGSPLMALQEIYRGQGRDEEALKLKEEYANLVDLDLGVRNELIKIYEKNGEDEKLAKTYLEILYVNPYARLDHAKIAEVFKKVGWWDKAGTEYEVALAQKHTDLPEKLLTEAARCYIKAGWHKKAKSLIIEAIQANAGYEEAREVKKEIEKHTGKFDIPKPEPEPEPEPEDSEPPGEGNEPEDSEEADDVRPPSPFEP